jgi:predicted nuclease of predicted toxin-antitoxin system
MKFLADECVDYQIIDLLRKNSYELLYIPEMDPGISDKEVFDISNKESAVLITADKDFGELVFRQGKTNSGVILLRLSGLPLNVKAEVVLSAIDRYHDEMINNFTVITPETIRIRNKDLS